MSNALALPRPRTNVARTISDLTSPPALAIPGLALSVWFSGASGAYLYAVLYFLAAVVAPLLYVVWLLKTRKITDFHLSDRRERVRPFIASLLGGAAAMALLIYFNAPTSFVAPLVALLGQTLLLFLVTLAWQISIHTATTAGLVTFAVSACGGAAGALFLLVPLVGWARVYLGRHTVGQATAGACLDCLCFTLLFALRGVAW